MVTLTQKAELWPRGENGEPVFRTDNDAIFYANLIYNKLALVEEIDLYRRMARREVTILRQKPDPDLDMLYEIAVKAQFFRECLDEVKRIREEQ
ncbi:hypothetical protein ES707_14079 [subsurface metagenome]